MKLFALTLLPIFIFVWWWSKHNEHKPTTTKQTSPLIGILTLRTPGGLLHTNGFTKTETFKREQWSLRGTTSSEIRLEASYHYNIQLRDKWNIYIDDTRKLAFVIAPPLKPQLPVAVDSKTVCEWTKSGWGRFDKWQQLEDLRRQTSNHLEQLAQSPAYIEAAKPKARISVEEFITDWLLKHRGWTENIKPLVKVYFANDEDIPFPEKTTMNDFLP